MLRIISQAKLPLPTHFDAVEIVNTNTRSKHYRHPVEDFSDGAFKRFGWKLTMSVPISNASCLGRWKCSQQRKGNTCTEKLQK